MNKRESGKYAAPYLEDWEEPDDELVSQVLIRLGDVQHRKVFYEGLENPLWVRKLDARRAFETAPVMASDASGRPRSRIWPEGEYLARMAGIVPERVAPIFERLAATDNFWVQRIIVLGVANMPASYGQPLTRFIIDYLKGSYRFYLEPGKLVDIVKSLETAGNSTAALKLLSALFRPRKTPGDGRQLRIQDVEAGLTDDSYERWLPESIPVIVALGEKGIRTVAAWLTEYERASRYSEYEVEDVSYIWRPSIETDEQPRVADEIGHTLVDTLIEVTKRCVEDGIDISSALAAVESTNEPILRRIRLEILAQLIGQIDALSDEVRVSVVECLLDRRSLGRGLWPEYARLARVFLPLASSADASAWVSFVQSGQIYPDEAEIRSILASTDPDDIDGKQIDDFKNRRLLDFLAGIGKDQLPVDLRAEFDQLSIAFGPPEDIFSPRVESLPFVGPISPISAADLVALGEDDLLDYLRSWRPIGGGFRSPSITGLARQVEQFVRADPGRLAGRAWELRDLNIAYIRAAISGWREALQEKTDFPMAGIWSLAGFIAMQQDDGAVPGVSIFEAELTWRYAQQEVARLIGAFFRLKRDDKLPDIEIRLLWLVVRPMISHVDPTPGRELQAFQGGMDPLTLSLNTTRPIAIRAAAYLVDALGRQEEPDKYRKLLADILMCLCDHVSSVADPSLAVAATFGEVLGILINVAPEWVEAQASALFGGIRFADSDSAAWSDTLFSVAVTAYGPSVTFLQHLRPWFIESFDAAYMRRSKVVGWKNPQSTSQHVASHILLLCIYGVIELEDELVQLLFSETTSEDRSDALGQLGWQFLRDVREERVRLRAQTLVDWRATEIRAGRADYAELGGFHWWVRSSQFPAEWWLPLLDLASENSAFDPHGALGKPLAEAAARFPLQTVALLSKLLPGNEQSWQRYDLVENAPAILAAALDSGDSEAREIARRVLNRLGREGHTGVSEVIKKYRNRVHDDGI
jgi:hypothetical protein